MPFVIQLGEDHEYMQQFRGRLDRVLPAIYVVCDNGVFVQYTDRIDAATQFESRLDAANAATTLFGNSSSFERLWMTMSLNDARKGKIVTVQGSDEEGYFASTVRDMTKLHEDWLSKRTAVHNALVLSITDPTPKNMIAFQTASVEAAKAESAYNTKLSDFSRTVATLQSVVNTQLAHTTPSPEYPVTGLPANNNQRKG